MADSKTIGIVGAGFSGSLLAVHLLRRCRPHDRVYLFESSSQFGRGLAYSTGNPDHLLNVRAGNMSAFSDRPGHFVEWLAGLHGPELGVELPERPTRMSFVPRQVFGAYIQDLLGNELWREGHARNTFLVNDRVVDIREDRGQLAIDVAGGRGFAADAAVVATGNPPPDKTDPGYFGNPWDPRALADLDSEAGVLLIGTGLTMVDVVVSLLGQGHEGPIHAISRRGLLPRRHVDVDDRRQVSLSPRARSSMTVLLRDIRREIAAAEREGGDWRMVIDALRPVTQSLWQGLPVAEKRRFLRHLRSWWDVHRHRMAPEVAAVVQNAMDRGQLVVRAGRPRAAHPVAAGFVFEFRPKGANGTEKLLVDRIINCSGPQTNYGALDDPLFQNLLGRGLARPDALDYGLDVTEDCALVGADGTPSERLFTLGPLTRGTFGEITAVPDIRVQCERLAEHIFSRLAEPSERGRVLPFRVPAASR